MYKPFSPVIETVCDGDRNVLMRRLATIEDLSYLYQLNYAEGESVHAEEAASQAANVSA